MKKVLFLFAAIVMFAITSCGSSSADAKAVAEKIESGAELTQSDYKVMLDYCQDVMAKTESLYKQAKEAQKDMDLDKAKKVMEEAQALPEKFPYADKFMECIASADDLDEANQKAFEKLMEAASAIRL